MGYLRPRVDLKEEYYFRCGVWNRKIKKYKRNDNLLEFFTHLNECVTCRFLSIVILIEIYICAKLLFETCYMVYATINEAINDSYIKYYFKKDYQE